MKKGQRGEGREAGRKEGQEGGREGGKKGGKEGGKWCKVRKSKLVANKLNEATGSLSVLIGLKMKSMSTFHTQ